MPAFHTAEAMEALGKSSQDRLALFERGPALVLALADGAGGMSGGREAANAVIAHVKRDAGDVQGDLGWAEFLSRIDRDVETDPQAGEAAVVVVELSPEGILGASVGDSRAWIVDGEEVRDLTRAQYRKPLLGSGLAAPVQFSDGPLRGTLIVATDGLFGYAKRDSLVRLARDPDLGSLPLKLIDSVRLKSGELWDDVSVLVCRAADATPSPKRGGTAPLRG